MNPFEIVTPIKTNYLESFDKTGGFYWVEITSSCGQIIGYSVTSEFNSQSNLWDMILKISLPDGVTKKKCIFSHHDAIRIYLKVSPDNKKVAIVIEYSTVGPTHRCIVLVDIETMHMIEIEKDIRDTSVKIIMGIDSFLVLKDRHVCIWGYVGREVLFSSRFPGVHAIGGESGFIRGFVNKDEDCFVFVGVERSIDNRCFFDNYYAVTAKTITHCYKHVHDSDSLVSISNGGILKVDYNIFHDNDGRYIEPAECTFVHRCDKPPSTVRYPGNNGLEKIRFETKAVHEVTPLMFLIEAGCRLEYYSIGFPRMLACDNSLSNAVVALKDGFFAFRELYTDEKQHVYQLKVNRPVLSCSSFVLFESGDCLYANGTSVKMTSFKKISKKAAEHPVYCDKDALPSLVGAVACTKRNLFQMANMQLRKQSNPHLPPSVVDLVFSYHKKIQTEELINKFSQ